MESKFKINEDIFFVHDYKIVKVRIKEVIFRQTIQGEVLEYVVSPLIWEKQGKEKLKTVREAYLVKTFKEAQKSALINWENIYKQVKRDLENFTEENIVEPIENDT